MNENLIKPNNVISKRKTCTIFKRLQKEKKLFTIMGMDLFNYAQINIII